jgi:uncharacterized protein
MPPEWVTLTAPAEPEPPALPTKPTPEPDVLGIMMPTAAPGRDSVAAPLVVAHFSNVDRQGPQGPRDLRRLSQWTKSGYDASSMPAHIHVDHQRLADFCHRHHIRRLAFFGSVLRDDFGPHSDVDVLYEFEPGHEPGWAIAQIEEELAGIIGRRVDLVPYKYLNPRMRERILRYAEVQYAA